MKIFITLFLSLLFITNSSVSRTNAQVLSKASKLTFNTISSKTAPKFPYINKWSNGRGEPMVINAATIRYGTDKPLKYRDVTKVSDGNHFNLEITTPGKYNYFTKYITLVINDADKSMKMTLYNTYKDMFDGNNMQSENTWYR